MTKKVRRVFTNEQKNTIVQLYYNSDITLRKLTTEMNLAFGTVHTWLAKFYLTKGLVFRDIQEERRELEAKKIITIKKKEPKMETLNQEQTDLLNEWHADIASEIHNCGLDNPLELSKNVTITLSLRTLFRLDLFCKQLALISEPNKNNLIDIAINRFVSTRNHKKE